GLRSNFRPDAVAGNYRDAGCRTAISQGNAGQGLASSTVRHPLARGYSSIKVHHAPPLPSSWGNRRFTRSVGGLCACPRGYNVMRSWRTRADANEPMNPHAIFLAANPGLARFGEPSKRGFPEVDGPRSANRAARPEGACTTGRRSIILQERGRVVARHYYANGGPGLGQAR